MNRLLKFNYCHKLFTATNPLRRFASARSVQVQTDPFILAKELSGKNLIGGKLVTSEKGQTFPVKNPATGKIIGNAARGDASDVSLAVSSSKQAFKSWSREAVRTRGNLVTECGEILKDHIEELAKLVSLETGKAIRTESRIEASLLPDVFKFFGGLASEIKGTTIPWSPTSLTYTVREAVGPVGVIIPWNVPLLLMSLKIAPALVCGNPVIVKSAEEAPFTVLRVAQILNQVLPPGTFNLLSGYGEDCGDALVGHPDIKKVTFTGSVETGKIIYKRAAEKLIPVTLELGGKSAMVIMKDAPLEEAVTGAITSMRFTRAGQSCTAASRIFVHEDIFDTFVSKMKDKVDSLKMGNPLDESTDIGSIISPQQLEKIKSYIELGKKTAGIKTFTCSADPTDPSLKDGLFVRPVIFTDVPDDHPITREEIFGPVTAIYKWRDFDDVISRANDTVFGLSASVWTNDLKAALHAVERLEAGIVQVNQNAVIQPNLPVGGWKSSGLGREGSLETMLNHFTHLKTVSINRK